MPGAQAPQARARDRLVAQIEGEVVVVAFDHRQARAVDRDGCPDRTVGHHDAAGDRQAPALERTHGAPLLNDPGEHRPPPADRVRRARHVGSSRSRAASIGAKPSPPTTPCAPRAGDDQRRDVLHDAIDHVLAQEAPGERGAPFEQDALDIPLAERGHQRGRRDAAGRIGLEHDRLGARGLPARTRASGACSVVATSVGAASSKTAAAGSIRPLESTTTRIGCQASARSGARTVSCGSSASTVPGPTTIASDHARKRWASARASGDEIQREDPSWAAVLPSSEAATFR